MPGPLTIGLPLMHKEPGERRDFLPHFVARLRRLGAEVVLEHGVGAGVGLAPADYQHAAPGARFVGRQEVYRQDMVLVLRCPTDDELRWMRPGACLLSMLHFPTRPGACGAAARASVGSRSRSTRSKTTVAGG